MSRLFRAADASAADRSELILKTAAANWVPMEYRPAAPWREYGSVCQVSGLGPMRVGVMDTLSLTARRTPKLISQADPGMLQLTIVCGGGGLVVEQDGRRSLLSPGDFTFCDTRLSFEVICGVDKVTRLMSLTFPPSLLPVPSLASRLTAARIPPTGGLGDLTSSFLLGLARNIDHLSAAEAARVSSAALEMVATRLVGELDVRDWSTPEARRQALLTTVQGFIGRHLGEPGLTPGMIAAAHHMSVRSLHQLFHDAGLTVAGWIRRRRLERCRRDLADPALAGRPVAAIAGRWGFSNAATFSRAFRAEYGVPPSEYRHSAQAANGAAR